MFVRQTYTILLLKGKLATITREKIYTRMLWKSWQPQKNFYNNIKRMSSNFMLERRKRITHSEEFKEITLNIFPLPYKTVGRDIVWVAANQTHAQYEEKSSQHEKWKQFRSCVRVKNISFLSSTLTRIAGRLYRQKGKKVV